MLGTQGTEDREWWNKMNDKCEEVCTVVQNAEEKFPLRERWY